MSMTSPKYHRALVFAAELHVDQSRRTARIPYLAHLLSVSANVWKNGGDENEAIGALLHDALEDQGHKTSDREIRATFGDKVADIVLFCTDETEETRKKISWRPRKQSYLDRLKDAADGAMLVIVCDKTDNALDIVRDLEHQGPKIWEKFTGKKEGMIWYHEELIKTIEAWLANRPQCTRPRIKLVFKEFVSLVHTFSR